MDAGLAAHTPLTCSSVMVFPPRTPSRLQPATPSRSTWMSLSRSALPSSTISRMALGGSGQQRVQWVWGSYIEAQGAAGGVHMCARVAMQSSTARQDSSWKSSPEPGVTKINSFSTPLRVHIQPGGFLAMGPLQSGHVVSPTSSPNPVHVAAGQQIPKQQPAFIVHEQGKCVQYDFPSPPPTHPLVDVFHKGGLHVQGQPKHVVAHAERQPHGGKLALR
jgi:hypothetical protein